MLVSGREMFGFWKSCFRENWENQEFGNKSHRWLVALTCQTLLGHLSTWSTDPLSSLVFYLHPSLLSQTSNPQGHVIQKATGWPWSWWSLRRTTTARRTWLPHHLKRPIFLPCSSPSSSAHLCLTVVTSPSLPPLCRPNTNYSARACSEQWPREETSHWLQASLSCHPNDQGIFAQASAAP